MARALVSIVVSLSILVLPVIAARGLSASKFSSLVPNYDLMVKLHPDRQIIEVTGTVQLPASNASRDSIPLLLSDQMHDFRVEVIQPTTSAGKAAVGVLGKSGARVYYGITPVSPVPANVPVLLRFTYSGGEKGGFVFHLGSGGSFAHGTLGAWYPLFDAGEYTGHVGILKFSVPTKNIVVATGKSRSTPAEMAQGEYRFEVTRPEIFSFASANYTIARRTDKPKLAAYLLRTRPNIDAYLEKCSKTLDLLARQFGRYPSEEFSLVEIPTESATGFFGASSPGMIFIPSKFIDSPFDYSLHGHEISHQWWGGSIGAKGLKGSFMLSEGMAQYGSLLTVETLEGSGAARRYRKTGYPSIGKYNFSPCEGTSIPIQSLHGYLMMTSTGGDQNLDSLKGEMAHGLAVSKGFLVLDLLSRTIGRERFRKSLADFTGQHANRQVTWQEFLRAISAGAGRDLKWFYEQWFERTDVPDWTLTWRQDGDQVRGSISQNGPVYQLDLEVHALGVDGKQRTVKSVELRSRQIDFVVPVGFHVTSVVLDPDYTVPHWTPDFRAEADEIKRCASK